MYTFFKIQPTAIAKQFFRQMDYDKNGQVSGKRLLLILMMNTMATKHEILKFAFTLWDED
jgi:Ca2+-binding EF-hand superfamily protein